MGSHWHDQLTEVYGGGRWILATDVLAAGTPLIEALEDLGAEDVLVVAGSRGTGPVPDDVESVVLGAVGTSLMDGIRVTERALADLPARAQATIDRFDPDRSARVIASPFSALATIGARPVFGARAPEWRVLEDKTTVDAVWRAAGVTQAPSVIADATPEALRAAAAAMDAGDGTVWVADNRRGWHGGASGLRWVRTDAQAREAAAFMAELAHRVRVMPFLDGVGCSVHGVVLPDRTIAFRPCEMIALRRPGRSDLLYAGMSTWWDPADADRAELRGNARRVGEHLRAAVGYRGALTIDGVMTPEGFRPTEMNPRYGAALNLLAGAAELPLYLLHLALVEGVDADWRPDELEQRVVDAADRTRSSSSFVLVETPQPDREVGLRWDDGELVDASDGDPDVVVVTGPGPAGGLVRVVVHGPPQLRGRSVAAVVLAALRVADTRWGLQLGPLEAPRDVRAAVA